MDTLVFGSPEEIAEWLREEDDSDRPEVQTVRG